MKDVSEKEHKKKEISLESDTLLETYDNIVEYRGAVFKQLREKWEKIGKHHKPLYMEELDKRIDGFLASYGAKDASELSGENQAKLTKYIEDNKNCNHFKNYQLLSREATIEQFEKIFKTIPKFAAILNPSLIESVPSSLRKFLSVELNQKCKELCIFLKDKPGRTEDLRGTFYRNYPRVTFLIYLIETDFGCEDAGEEAFKQSHLNLILSCLPKFLSLSNLSNSTGIKQPDLEFIFECAFVKTIRILIREGGRPAYYHCNALLRFIE